MRLIQAKTSGTFGKSVWIYDTPKKLQWWQLKKSDFIKINWIISIWIKFWIRTSNSCLSWKQRISWCRSQWAMCYMVFSHQEAGASMQVLEQFECNGKDKLNWIAQKKFFQRICEEDESLPLADALIKAMIFETTFGMKINPDCDVNYMSSKEV